MEVVPCCGERRFPVLYGSVHQLVVAFVRQMSGLLAIALTGLFTEVKSSP